jgi:DNA-binding GntR family transcriptional regulator
VNEVTWQLYSVVDLHVKPERQIASNATGGPRMVSAVDDPASAILPAPELRERRTTSDYVADALREAISSGRLADGAVLNQVHVAEQLGVSRVPVREAMRQLEAEGLIDASAHRSPTVRALDRNRVAELFELRGLLEGLLVAAATPRIDAATLDKAADINAQMRKTDDPTVWLGLNREFHTVLYAPAGKIETAEVLDQIRGRAERYVHSTMRKLTQARVRSVTREHAAILKLMRTDDADGAREAVIEHVKATSRFLEQHRPPPPAPAA